MNIETLMWKMRDVKKWYGKTSGRIWTSKERCLKMVSKEMCETKNGCWKMNWKNNKHQYQDWQSDSSSHQGG